MCAKIAFSSYDAKYLPGLQPRRRPPSLFIVHSLMISNGIWTAPEETDSDASGMRVVAEGNVLRGRARELVFQTFADSGTPHAGVAEWVERLCRLKEGFVVVHRARGEGDNGPRDACAVVQGDVLHGFAVHGHWVVQSGQREDRNASEGSENKNSKRTGCDWAIAQGFPEDAVELPHISEGGGSPVVRRDAPLNLFSEWREELGVLREMVEDIASGLRRITERFVF